MSRIRTLIAEDEPLASESLAEWVAELPQLELVGVCADGVSALNEIRRLKPSLVFMDIHMPGMTGLQVLRALAAAAEGAGGEPVPAVVFTTAYDEHAITAFELHAADYLLKPFSQERFNDAVDHALQNLPSSSQLNNTVEAVEQTEDNSPLKRLLVRDQGKIFPLQVEAIEHLRSDTKYTAVCSAGRQFLVRLPIATFETRLDPKHFIRLQRSCIVNLDFVESMTPDENSNLVVKMSDGTCYTASREVSKKLRDLSI